MISVLIYLINIIANVLIILIFASVILSYFMSPYHPIRQWIDRIVEPMLNPIRRIIRPIGGLDLSPIVLLILIQVVQALLQRLLVSFY